MPVEIVSGLRDHAHSRRVFINDLVWAAWSEFHAEAAAAPPVRRRGVLTSPLSVWLPQASIDAMRATADAASSGEIHKASISGLVAVCVARYLGVRDADV